MDFSLFQPAVKLTLVIILWNAVKQINFQQALQFTQ